jgi:hypothetical protein
VGTAHNACFADIDPVERIGAFDDDDLVDRSLGQALEHGRQKHALLW